MNSFDIAYVLAEKAIRQVFDWHSRIKGIIGTSNAPVSCGFDTDDSRIVIDGWSGSKYGDCNHPVPSEANRGERTRKLCEPLLKFHVVIINGVTISPETLSTGLLRNFDIFTLRDILMLYKVQIPSKYQLSMIYCRPVTSKGSVTPYAHDPFTTHEHLHVHGKTIKFHHMHSLDTTIEYIRERITSLNASDDSINNGDLVKQNHRLTQELTENKHQLAKIKNLLGMLSDQS